MRDTTTSCC